MPITQGNPLPGVGLPMGFEPGAICLDCSGMRAAGSGDGWRGQYPGAFGQLGVRRIVGSAFGRHLPCPAKLPRAERMGERLEVLRRRLRGAGRRRCMLRRCRAPVLLLRSQGLQASQTRVSVDGYLPLASASWTN